MAGFELLRPTTYRQRREAGSRADGLFSNVSAGKLVEEARRIKRLPVWTSFALFHTTSDVGYIWKKLRQTTKDGPFTQLVGFVGRPIGRPSPCFCRPWRSYCPVDSGRPSCRNCFHDYHYNCSRNFDYHFDVISFDFVFFISFNLFIFQSI